VPNTFKVVLGIKHPHSNFLNLGGLYCASDLMTYVEPTGKYGQVAMAPAEDRTRLIDGILDRVSVDTRGLAREQRYDLAIRLIKHGSQRFRTIGICIFSIQLMSMWHRKELSAGTSSTTRGFQVRASKRIGYPRRKASQLHRISDKQA
jgi:hypothetical protein